MDSWKEGAAKRRDQRNTKVSDDPKPAPAKKDTKKFCKGKVGTPHQLECVKYVDAKKIDRTGSQQRWRILVCKVCGKELDIYYGNTKQKPDWVVL